MESEAVFCHDIAENCSVHRRGNFGGAGRFGAIADNSADIGKGVDDGAADGFKVSSMKISDARACSGRCRDRPAECGERTDLMFKMNGRQV